MTPPRPGGALAIALVLLGTLPLVVGAGDAEPRLRLNACAGTTNDVGYWRRALGEGDVRARVHAVQALGQSRSAGAVEALTEALKDAAPEVRSEAARALRNIERPR